jgi:hypothetical protein
MLPKLPIKLLEMKSVFQFLHIKSCIDFEFQKNSLNIKNQSFAVFFIQNSKIPISKFNTSLILHIIRRKMLNNSSFIKLIL